MSRRQSFFAPVVFAAAVVLLPGADQSFGQEKDSAGKEKLSAEQRIEKALDSPASLNHIESPLTDVIEELADHHHIRIQIDQRALDDMGMSSDIPVTRDLKDVSLRSALNLTLRGLDLTYVIVDEVLLITTQEAAEEMLVTKVYDVADLVACRDETGKPWEDYDSLIELITGTFVPDSWVEAGGPGSICAGTFGTAKILVVSQTEQVQHEIANLVEQIREVVRKNPSGELPLRSRPRCTEKRRHAPEMGGMGAGLPGRAPSAAPKPGTKPETKQQHK